MSTCKTLAEYINEAENELRDSYPNMTDEMIDHQVDRIKSKIQRSTSGRENIKIDGLESGPIEFYSPDGDKIDLEQNSGSQILAATMIADQRKVKEVFNALVDIDENKLSEDHRRLLDNTIDEMIDWNRDTIPEMVQRINTNAEQTGGSLRIEDEGQKKAGLDLKVNRKFNTNYLYMTAAETYAHEVLHAGVELAQKYHAGSIVGTMNDISDVYDQFMEVVKVEDFMPSKEDSVDEVRERELATKRLNHMLDPDVGINEFIVMSKTNMLVHNVLRDRVKVKKKDRDTSTLWKKLTAAIGVLLETARLFTRGNKVGMDGAEAMGKYIVELNRANMGATERVKSYNRAINAVSNILDFMNGKGNKLVLKAINRFKKATEGAIINSEAFTNLTRLQKVKEFSKTIGYFMSHPESRGSFETWLELLPFGVGMPEGTLQQILIKLRTKDDVAKAVENVGLQSQKLEGEVGKRMAAQAALIDALFKEKLTDAESISLTKILAELDVEMLIDNDANNPDTPDRNHSGIKLVEFANVLRDEQARKDLFNKKALRLKRLAKDSGHYNFMMSQILGLGDYMVTGEAGDGQLLNSGSIVSRVGLNNDASSVSKSHETDEGIEMLDLVNQLASLEALGLASQTAKDKVANLIDKDPEAIAGSIDYLRGMNVSEKDMFKSAWHYDFFRVKGATEKNHASWINLKTAKLTDKDELEKEGYKLLEGATAEEGYGVFRNSSHGQAGFQYEGIRATNFGRRVNSLIDGYKKSLYTENSGITTKQVNKKALAELQDRQKRTLERMMDMTKRIQRPIKSGSSPVYKVGKGGVIYISDYDISVNKEIQESELDTKNKFGPVVGKTIARFYDMIESKKINDYMLDILFEDMDNNYELGQRYYNGGKNNQMTYVKIGPNEDGDLSKEIWPVMPRHMKVKIMQNHNKKTLQRLTEIAKNNPEINKLVVDDRIRGLIQKSKEQVTEQKRLLIEVQIGSIIREKVGKLDESRVSKESKEALALIINAEPHVAVRRNLVYHYFGNREATLGGSDTIAGEVIRSNKYTREFVGLAGTIIKEIASIKKVDVVLRNLPTLTGNINGNFLLNTLKGNNPISEAKKQTEGFKQLSLYHEISQKIDEEKIKINAVNVDEKGYEDKIDRIERKIKMLETKLRKNLAHPLVEAGLFSSSAEDLDNTDLFRGTYVQTKIDNTLKWVPSGVRETLDTLYITQSTPLYSGLLKFMQYSDFAARYSRYHKLISEGASQEAAVEEVKNNQVNYDEGTGKALQWLSAFLVVPFPKFRVGIQKPIIDLVVDKPFNAAIGIMMAMATGNSNAPMAQTYGANGFNHNTVSWFKEMSEVGTDGFDLAKMTNDIAKFAGIK